MFHNIDGYNIDTFNNLHNKSGQLEKMNDLQYMYN